MKPRDTFKLFKSAAWFLMVFALACPGPVSSNPVAPVITHGSASFVESGSSLVINQFTDRAIIDWQSFSIGVGDTTQFIQPGASSAVLNRVRGNAASLIDGRLLANGRVFLLNSNGILIGKTGYIDTAGFVASTLDIDDEEFLRGGDLHFRGSSTASVVNLGTIKASAGDVVLIGATVRNDGTIGAPRGMVGLGAGQDVILMARGDRRIKVRTGKGQIINRGVIEANIAELEARNGNVAALAIRNDGRIAATGVTKRGGRIFLSAKGGSKIRNTGRLQARAARSARARPRISVDAGEGAVEAGGTIDASNENGEGGFVAILGSEINIPMDTVIISDGETGGGEIYVGGGESGLNPDLGNATNVRIDAGAQISANAINSGNGGRAIVFAEDTLNFSGHISATGGQQSGDGGFIELSGQKQIFIDNLPGQVNLDAPAGRAGMLLLDPIDVNIIAGPADMTVEGTLITDGAINAFLTGTGSLTINTSEGEGTGDINIYSGANITWASGNSLTFNADNNFQNDGIIDGSGDVIITTGGFVFLNDYIKGSSVNINEMDLGDGVSMTVDTPFDYIDGNTSSSTGLLYDRGLYGEISLREAIIAANNDSLFNDIAFSPSIDGAPIDVMGYSGEDFSATGDLDITAGSQIRLLGNGTTNTIIQSDGFDRVFDVWPGAELELQSLTIRDGYETFGGLLFNDGGTVTISDSLLTGGFADYGGAIYNSGALTINSFSTISDNTADYGGAIYNDYFGLQTINNSYIEGNTAFFDGGGISNSGQQTINNSTIWFNDSLFGDGGGIYNDYFGQQTINDSFIAYNTADLGGGINNAGLQTIYNSYIDGNFAYFDGGGIYNSGQQTINNSTIWFNDSLYGNGGGIYNDYYGQQTINNSFIAYNTADLGGGINNAGLQTIYNSYIDGNFAFFDGGGISNSGLQTINNSTIWFNDSLYGYGGGIHNDYYGQQTINDSFIAYNTADLGGGINNAGLQTIYNSYIDGNFAYFYGGGIHNDYYGQQTIYNSSISGNIAFFDGGGISNSGLQTINNSTIWFNDSLYGNGGGIHNDYYGQQTMNDSFIAYNTADIGGGINNDGDQTINNSVIAGNFAYFYGGGVHNGFIGRQTINNSIISGNIAEWGGGIDNEGQLTINNSTISGNCAVFGGGISNFMGQLTINNSIISGNCAEIGGGIDNFLGELTINDSDILGNSAEFGGGISNFGELTTNESTITDNFAMEGGGIANEGELTINESTISGNTDTLNQGEAPEGDILGGGGEITMAAEGDGSTGGMFPTAEFRRTPSPTVTPNQTQEFGAVSLSGGVASVNAGSALTRTTKPEVRAALDLVIGGDGVAPVSKTDGVTSIAAAGEAFQMPELVTRVLESAYDYRAESELSLAMGGDGSFSLPKTASTVTLSFSAPPARRQLAEIIKRSLAPGRASGLSRALGSNGTVPVDSSNKSTGVTPDDLLTDPRTELSLDSNITGEAENDLAAALNGSF